MDEEPASLVSAFMNAFCKDHLWKDGAPSAAHCMVIDLASGKVYPVVKSIKQRLKAPAVRLLHFGRDYQVAKGNGPSGGLSWGQYR